MPRRRQPSLAFQAVFVLAACFAPASPMELGQAALVARDVFQHKQLSHAIALLCSQEDALQMVRILDMRVSTPLPSKAEQAFVASRVGGVSATGVFVHLGCWDTWAALQQSWALGLFDGSFHWVLTGNSTTSRADLVRAAEVLPLAVNSEVTLAVSAPGPRSGTVHLVDVYRIAPERTAIAQLAGSWSEGDGLHHFLFGPTAVRRRDLQGHVLRAGVLVDGHKDSEIPAIISKPKDNDPLVSPVAAFSHVLTMHLQDLLNMTLRLQGGTIHSLLDRIAKKELNLITTTTEMEPQRWSVLDYTSVPLWAERTILVLKNPSALWTYDAFTRPLHWAVWLLVIAVILGVASILRAVGHWEVGLVPDHHQEEDSWNSAIMTAMSMVCAQGFTNTSNWLSGRTALLTFELFSLFINLFYSSGIVTFLLTFPPPYAHSVEEIVDSPFTVGVDKNAFSVSNFSESSDPLVRELYAKKIDPENNGGGFLDLQEAGDIAQDEQFAFVGSPFTTYEMLALSWSQSDICRIQEIQLKPPALLAFATAKLSPFREIINLGILLLVERGLYARERIRWSLYKPRCALSDVTDVDDVGLRPVTPVLGILALGLALSLTFLVLEFVRHRQQSRKNMVVDLLQDLGAEGRRSSEAEKKAA